MGREMDAQLERRVLSEYLFPSTHDARDRLQLGAIQWKSYSDLILAVVEDGLRLVSPIDTSIPHESVLQQGSSLASGLFGYDMCK